MNQDMDGSSILDQPSDIDELEKEKAINSIVLNSGNNYSSRFDDEEEIEEIEEGVDNNDNDDIDMDDEDIVGDDDDETDTLMMHTADSSSNVNVTNSMYDESLKSTDAENGSESCMEAKEMDLDSLDGERATNTVASEPTSTQSTVHPSKSPSPSKTPSPLPRTVSPNNRQRAAESEIETEIELEPVTPASLPNAKVDVEKSIVSSSSGSISTVSTTATSSSSSPPQPSSNNKFYYVKFLPKASTQQQPIVMAVPQSPPKTISLAAASPAAVAAVAAVAATEVPEEKQPVSPERVEEPTTSTITSCVEPLPPPPPSHASSSSSKSIGHTVNLLNNNRILIKKNNNHHYHHHHRHGHHRSNSSVSKSTANNSNDAAAATLNPIAIQMKEAVDTKSDIAFCPVTPNVQHDGVVVDDIDMKCEPSTDNGSSTSTSTSSLEIKREQLLNDNSMDGGGDDDDNDNDKKDAKHFVNVINTSDTVANALAIAADDTNSQQTKIKREYEQLQKTVNQSKVLSEFIIERIRKKRNRRPTKPGETKHWKHNIQSASHNTAAADQNSDGGKMDRCSSPSSSSVRSASKESDRSSSYTPANSVTAANVAAAASATAKRNTRSQNMDFSAKQKRFLKGIQQITRGTDDETDNQSDAADDDDDDDLDYLTSKKQQQQLQQQQPHITERRKSTYVKAYNLDTKSLWDKYCWRCHVNETNLNCSCCIRSYHANCLKMKILTPSEQLKWQCPECVEIKLAEKENKKKKFDVKHFNKLLKYAMNRILQDPNLQQFQFPVNKTQNPGYSDIIVNPINLSKIESNIDNLVYTNSEAFLSDIKWILHNCSIYFSDNYKVTRAAKALQKVSKQEVGDIETCAECYLNANTMTDNWFTEVCAKPHLILWAKLKGFPYWPAKAMSINSTLVDVRFFGEHDRANIPSKDCYLYSREDPNPPTNKYKRNTIADCVKEVDIYIENIEEKYGGFKYAELKTPFNPQTAEQHLHEMIPGLRSTRGRRRSSTARSDLTLKIVKTADNHLSVVKKEPASSSSSTNNIAAANATGIMKIPDQLPPQIKRTVDITGDGVVSRTPTPPSAILARRKTSDTRIKRSKSTNRHSDGLLGAAAGKLASTLNAKSAYQRRKSMAVEKLDQKRVNVIQANLDLNSSNESASTTTPSTPDVSFVQYTPSKLVSSTDHKSNETEIGAKRPPNNSSTKSQLKKRKLSSSDHNEAPIKLVKRDTPHPAEQNDDTATARRTISADKSLPDDANILRSVGLVRKTSAAVQSAQKKRVDPHSPQTGTAGRGRPSKVLVQTKTTPTKTCDTMNDEISNDSSATARTQINRANSHEDDGDGDGSALVLVPFLEVKKETENETTSTATGKNVQTSPSASAHTNTPISIPSSSENTPAKNDSRNNASTTAADDNLSIIKTETSSDDDSLMIIEDDLDNNTTKQNSAAATTAPIDEQLERRGIITVRDFSKMTGAARNPMPSARKSFPKGPATQSILKPRSLTTATPSQITAAPKQPPMNNMVSIPLDGLPRLDVIYNSTQPPPLSVVGSGGNSLSLLAQNKSTSLTTPAASAAASQAMSNGPPPLSITTVPAVVSIVSSATTNISSSSSSSAASSSSSQHNNFSNLMTNLSNGTITEQMASAVTDMIVRPNPPSLTARPTAPLRSDGDTVFPSEAGSISKTLTENSHKMADFFRTVIEDTVGDLAVEHAQARVRVLELELENERLLRQKELNDLKANFERLLTEMKKSSEKDRQRVINEIRKQCELERIRSVEDAKRRQWCANCFKEAQFYCCWNTSYCNYVCQRKHWDQHMNACTQPDSTMTSANAQNIRKSNLKTQPKGEIRSQSVHMQQPQQQPQIQTKVTQISGQKDNNTNAILAGTRSATRIANNPASIPALRNILPKNAVVSINSSPNAQQRHHFNQTIQTQGVVKQPPNPCIIVSRPMANWPSGSTASKSATSLLHSNAIYLPSTQSFATIANVTKNSGSSSGSGGVSLLNTSQSSQKSLSNETIIIT